MSLGFQIGSLAFFGLILAVAGYDIYRQIRTGEQRGSGEVTSLKEKPIKFWFQLTLAITGFLAFFACVAWKAFQWFVLGDNR